MKRNPILVILVILALMLACNAPTGAAQPQTPTETQAAAPAAPSATQNVAAASDTPSPSATLDTSTATPTLTLTPSTPMVTPLKDAVNCRFSTNSNFEGVGPGLAVGASAPLLGKTTDGAWWEIKNPNGPEMCWLSAAVTTTSGDVSTVPVVMPPTALVTDVNVTVKPPSINLGPGCPGPAPLFSFQGTIYANGPVVVQWHFETQKGGALSTHSTTFTKYGSMNVSDSYKPSLNKGNYWVKLVITSPNMMATQSTFQVLCQ